MKPTGCPGDYAGGDGARRKRKRKKAGAPVKQAGQRFETLCIETSRMIGQIYQAVTTKMPRKP